MKQTLTCMLFVLMTIGFITAQEPSTNWNHEIKVEGGEQTFDDQRHFAYTTTVFEARENAVRKLVIDEIKTRTEAKATKKAITEGLKIDLPKLDEDGISVKAKTDVDKSSDHVDLSIAFLKDDVAINPDDFPEGHKSAMEIMRDFSVQLNRSVVMTQILDAEKELTSLENKHQALQAQREKLDKSIESDQGTIENLNSENKKLQRKLETAQGKATSLQTLSEGAGASEKNVKKYAKAKKEVSNVEHKILKNNEILAKYNHSIEDTQVDIPKKDQEIVDVMAMIEKQTTLVTSLNQKHDSIK